MWVWKSVATSVGACTRTHAEEKPAALFMCVSVVVFLCRLFSTRVCHQMKCVGSLQHRHCEVLRAAHRHLLIVIIYMFAPFQICLKHAAMFMCSSLLCYSCVCDHKTLPPDDMCRESAKPALLGSMCLHPEDIASCRISMQMNWSERLC